MSCYKVEYLTLALMEDGGPGNINQGGGTIYTNVSIDLIPNILDKHLKKEKRVGVIKNIKKVNGECIV